jgi:hypothetical protein
MRASKEHSVYLAAAVGLLLGALAAAWQDGRISLSGWLDGSERQSALAATTACNPNEVSLADLDGELPGGG